MLGVERIAFDDVLLTVGSTLLAEETSREGQRQGKGTEGLQRLAVFKELWRKK